MEKKINLNGISLNGNKLTESTDRYIVPKDALNLDKKQIQELKKILKQARGNR